MKMQEMRHWVLALSIAAGFIADAAPADAARGYHSGNMCLQQYDYPSSVGGYATFWRQPDGLYYFDTTYVTSVFCPVRIDASGSINPTGASVKVLDYSTLGDIHCTPQFEDDGAIYGLGTRYSCNTAGGCTSPALSQGIDGYLTWADSEFPSGNLSGKLSAAFVCSIGKVDPQYSEWMILGSYELVY